MLSVASMVYVGDSDDSDTEGGLGNIEKVVMRPPGHSGKAKRGHLCFDASFETGNLGRVDFITENEYDLFIRPDTCNPRVRFWFHFTVDNVQEDQRVIFNIVNLSRTRNLFQQGMTPVVRSTSRKKWRRLPSSYVYFYNSPEHSDNMVLSFAFAFDKVENEKYDFALAFPYSYSRCRQVEEIISKRAKYVKCEPFSKTIQNRQISLLTITSNVAVDSNVGKRLVVILARSHPGESPSSFVVQGMLEFLSSEHEIAADLRKKIVFKIFPMLNPDGVFLGNSRSTLLGSDLNRHWLEATQFNHPILYLVKNFILNQSKKFPLDFVIDLHCSSSLIGIFIQGNSYESVYRNERHSVFPKMLAQNCPDFCAGSSMYNADTEKEGTARRFFGQILAETTNVYSLEVSMFGQYNASKKGVIPYTEEDYSLHGRRICRAFWDYFKVMNVINDGGHKSVHVDSNDGAGLVEVGFSMVRLKEIANLREMFSSIESLSNESSESDSPAPKLEQMRSKRSGRRDVISDDSSTEDMTNAMRSRKFSRRRTNSSENTSLTSSMREFIQENPDSGFRKLNFLEYRKSLRQKQLLRSFMEKEPFRIVGKKIHRPDDPVTVNNKMQPLESLHRNWFVNCSNELMQTPRYILPYNTDTTQPRHILTISRVKLRQAANDKAITEPPEVEDFESGKSHWRIQDAVSTVFVNNRKKIVGGGGVVIPSVEEKCSKTNVCEKPKASPSPRSDQSLHLEIRLDSHNKEKSINKSKSPSQDSPNKNRRRRRSKKRKNETGEPEIETMVEDSKQSSDS